MGPRFFLVWAEGRSEGGSGIRGMKNLREGFASAPACLFGRGIGRDYLVGIFRDKSIFYLKGNCGGHAGMKRDFWGYPQYTQKLSTKEGFMELECRSMKEAALRGIRFALVDCPGAVRPAFKLLFFASSSAG